MTRAETETRALSRRSFLVGTGVTGMVVAFGPMANSAFAAAPKAFEATPWVHVGSNGIVTIMSPASEMGQGVMTSVPMLVAEELDADWRKVKIIQSPTDAKVFGNPVWNNTLTTYGSGTIRGYWEKARIAGAQARKVLIAAASEQMKVPAAELTTERGMVVHKKSGKKLSYGALARKAKVPDPMPQATKADLKKPSEFRILGKNLARVDVPLKVNGSAKYGIDTELPNMLYAAVLRPPVQGEKPVSIDDSAAKAVKGIVKIVTIPTGVGIIGDTVWGTKKAKAALKVTWSTTAKARNYTSAQVGKDYLAIAHDDKQAGVVMMKKGDAAGGIAGAATVIAADFVSEHVSHATMEPMNCTAKVDGDNVEVWISNQSPTNMMNEAAKVVGTKPDKVTVHTPFLGGGFGRRSEGIELIDAVHLAKEMPGRPIKLIWSREDDVQHDLYRPLSGQRIEVGLDANGKIAGWRHRIVTESDFARSNPYVFNKFLKGRDVVTAGGGEFVYPVADHQVQYIRTERGVDVGAWRGIAPGYTKFAIETVIDEIAAHNKMDPMAYRLSLVKGHEPRATHLLETVAKMSRWDKKRKGRALGVAYSDSPSHAAAVVEVSLNRKSGRIQVHHVWAAVDPGHVLQPDNVAAQMEGSIIFALGAGLIEEIHIKDGAVQEANFDTYSVVRMSDVPPIEVKVISTDNAPTGIGEAGIPMIAPAIANAVATLTGKRLRHLPMTPERVQEALKA